MFLRQSVKQPSYKSVNVVIDHSVKSMKFYKSGDFHGLEVNLRVMSVLLEPKKRYASDTERHRHSVKLDLVLPADEEYRCSKSGIFNHEQSAGSWFKIDKADIG